MLDITIDPTKRQSPHVFDKEKLHLAFRGPFQNILNERVLFTIMFREMPNIIEEQTIDCDRAIEWFKKNHGSEIRDYFYFARAYGNHDSAMPDNVVFLLHEDMVVYFEIRTKCYQILFKNTSFHTVNNIHNQLNKYRVTNSTTMSNISLLVSGDKGISTKSMEFKRYQISLETNYNDDFLSIHSVIQSRLSKDHDKGLVLLHGKPGTGKTSYVRYLISQLKKEVIFLTTELAKAITQPGLISILIDNPNSVLVIEDAENLLLARGSEQASPVSALLNIADGLLADCLNIQVICSFNTDISRIDSALLRKGRLIAKYEFKELTTQKAQKLFETLGSDFVATSPMTLADIYNQTQLDFTQSQAPRKIGFSY